MPDLTSATWDDPVVQALTAAQQEELRARYGGHTEPGVPPSAEDVAPALVARDDDGEPVGCGALRLVGIGDDQDRSLYFERTPS